MEPIALPPAQTQLPPHHAPTSLKIVLLVFVIVLIGVLGYLVWYQNNTATTLGGDTIIKPKTTTSQTSAPASLTYTNATYGFSVTLDSKWTGYKIKTVKPTDGSATAYFYVCLPTTSTDAAWAKDSSTGFALFPSVMAIGVYTPTQWAALAGTPGQGTKLNQSTQFVFDYSQAQSIPTDLKAAYDDVKTVVATFKLTK